MHFQKHGIPWYRNYTWGSNHNLTWLSNDTFTSPQGLFNAATYNLQEIIQNFSVFSSEPNGNGQKEMEIALDTTSGNFKEVRHRNFGRCYTFDYGCDKRSFIVSYIKAYL